MRRITRLVALIALTLVSLLAPVTPASLAAPASVPTTVRATSVTITKHPGTVRRGATASVAVRTSAKTRCSITVRYKSGPSTAAGLVAKQTDANGRAAWSWKVGTRTTPGSWPVIITCAGVTARTVVKVP